MPPSAPSQLWGMLTMRERKKRGEQVGMWDNCMLFSAHLCRRITAYTLRASKEIQSDFMVALSLSSHRLYLDFKHIIWN